MSKKEIMAKKKVPTLSKRGNGKSSYHFRRYKKVEGGRKKRAKHPKLIVEQRGNQYGFMGLTESPKRGHHSNIPLQDNPQKGRTTPAYIREELRYDSVEHFSEILQDYQLSPRDVRRIEKILQKYKKK